MARKETEAQKATGIKGLEIALDEIVNAVEDELLVIDNNYKVRFVNSVALTKLQQISGSPVGKTCYQVFYNSSKPCSAPLWDCPLRKVLSSGSMTTAIHPVRTLGTDTYLKVTAYPLRDSQGNIKAIVELRRDVTLERELEHQILRRHHQLLALSQVSAAVSGVQDLEAILNMCLDTVLEIINGEIGGILLFDDQSQELSYRVYRGLSAKYVEEVQITPGEGIAGIVVKTGEPILVEDVTQDPRVAHRDLISTEGLRGFASVPLTAKDKVVGVMNIASHLPGHFSKDDLYLLNSIGYQIGTAIEQAKLYQRLENARERYQTLLQHALTAQERERKRVARELHDETSQAITSITLSLQALIGMAEIRGINDAEFKKRLKTTHSFAIHAGNEIVKLMKELRPTLLDELGLPAAIQRYAKDNLQAHGINVSAKFIGTDERLQPEVEVTLFRVAQGAIGNILEHSGAKNTSIKLECNTNECTLTIEDDGKGFDVSKLTKVEPSGRGAGLFTIRERMRLVGGTGHVASRPGQGTKLTARAPLVRDITDEEDKGTDS